MNDLYCITFRTTSDEELPANLPAEASLAEVIATCKHHGIEADLFDEAGFRKGWVHADGGYTLT